MRHEPCILFRRLVILLPHLQNWLMIWIIMLGYRNSFLIVKLNPPTVLLTRTLLSTTLLVKMVGLYRSTITGHMACSPWSFQTGLAQSILNHTMDTLNLCTAWFEYVAFQTTSPEHSRLLTMSMFFRLQGLNITERKGTRDVFLIYFTDKIMEYETRSRIT